MIISVSKKTPHFRKMVVRNRQDQQRDWRFPAATNYMRNLKHILSSEYGLGKGVRIVEISERHIGIVKHRKSRIIMKDGGKIKEIADKIREKNSDVRISLISSGPICSKTKAFLRDNSINIVLNPIFD